MQFYQRLKNYYLDVAKVLRGEADAASIFPNSADIGTSREAIYAKFLRQHAPSKCNVFFGGFIFGDDGTESGQLDVIITTDTTPQFNFHVKDGIGKAFSPVEGTLGVASIKSTLNKNELEKSLMELARIPPMGSLEKRVNPQLSIKNYEDWPYKIIYASDGIDGHTLLKHLNEFYSLNPNIPISRRPNIIHVVGKYAIFKIDHSMEIAGSKEMLKVGDFHLAHLNSDIQAIVWTLDSLQRKAAASNHIIYTYTNIINRVVE